MHLPAGTVLDRYTIEAPLGKGGMAVVYRARHAQLGTQHAIKILTIPSEPIRQRLLQEGRVQATLKHPNIVNVSDVIEVDNCPGLVMEFVQGPSLHDLIYGGEPLTVAQIDALGRGIVEGVAEAHRHGLIHRDLKPANIMIAVTPRGLVPKVTDFGLAKVLGGDDLGVHKTASGISMGTPAYMAPEQVRNAKNVDARVDLFALGAILYELATRSQAFKGDDILTVFSAIAAGDYTPIRQLVPDLPDRMVQAINGALTIDRDQRIQDCDALLAAWTAGTPSPAEKGLWPKKLLERYGQFKPDEHKLEEEIKAATGTYTRTTGQMPRPSQQAVAAAPTPASGGWVLPAAVGLLIVGLGAIVVIGVVVVLILTRDPGDVARAESDAGTATAAVVAPADPQPGKDATPVSAPSAPSVAGTSTDGATTPATTPSTKPATTEAATSPATSATTPSASSGTTSSGTTSKERPKDTQRPKEGSSSSGATSSAATSSATTSSGTTSAAPAEAKTGHVVINCLPYCTSVAIAGQSGVRTPWKGDVPAGRQKVKLQSSDGRSASPDFDVVADQSSVLCWDFDLGGPCAR